LHIGSSVLIFGYFGYLAVRGIFLRSFTSIALSLLVIAIYGWMVLGVLPTQPGVSWQMHLFGAAGGVLAAKEPRPSSVG
jgi:membrane associated rhomboid family serine protease